MPIPLDPEEERDKNHSISPCQFHNLFYDGFYAPYMSNPDYLMLVDVRDENSFLERHILSARWYGFLPLDNLQDLSKYTLIVLYDQDGSGENQDSNMNKVQTLLRNAQLDPFCICGGIAQIERSLPYMISSSFPGVPERQLALGWYPSIILEDTMWLGRMEQGSNTTILLNLNVTHLIHIGQTGPALAFPGMTCLTVNWSETLKGKQSPVNLHFFRFCPRKENVMYTMCTCGIGKHCIYCAFTQHIRKKVLPKNSSVDTVLQTTAYEWLPVDEHI